MRCSDVLMDPQASTQKSNHVYVWRLSGDSTPTAGYLRYDCEAAPASLALAHIITHRLERVFFPPARTLLPFCQLFLTEPKLGVILCCASPSGNDLLAGQLGGNLRLFASEEDSGVFCSDTMPLCFSDNLKGSLFSSSSLLQLMARILSSPSRERLRVLY